MSDVLMEILDEVNELLRAYNYLSEDDEDLNLEEIPSVISHLLLLKIFTQEGMHNGIKYDEVDDFSEFCIDQIYKLDQKEQATPDINIDQLVDKYRASNNSKQLKH
jgi:hypothetical protein